mmetsp:Transcript_10813/g.21713  ORF Transcript_10813/g.21713 Transcript_10813/m.21713 type:complete len:209 (+) Transcript_10813:240-866(+)|eukprot:CAMPEP_0181347892 /NCGR_PEP_ID=MMETSP1101-20121128/34117_1 /TAXON_ID=46948 /ORGANISM="Rhodomonas abbreviata, Strain Caron Lab Isolate" /LENGTH=208 /DNA_ID=CAMNT_0023460129 /DNA_START=228 /DNA_END=854 /DNA_ORIENTATION=-
MALQGVAAFGHIAPPVVVYAKQPVQQRGNRTLLCFPSEFTQYVFCVNAAGRKWDISKRYRDFISFEGQLMKHFSEADLAGREPLPEKNFFLTNSPSFIEHRRWRLEMFINSLAHCPVVAHSDMFKTFLEYAEMEGGQDALDGLMAFEREQEALKMQKLSALANLPPRNNQRESTTSLIGAGFAPVGSETSRDQWAWAGDALSIERPTE